MGFDETIFISALKDCVDERRTFTAHIRTLGALFYGSPFSKTILFFIFFIHNFNIITIINITFKLQLQVV